MNNSLKEFLLIVALAAAMSVSLFILILIQPAVHTFLVNLFN